MDGLPNEMLVKILGLLPCADLCRFTQLNHHYGYLIDSHRNSLAKPYVHITLDSMNTQLVTIQRTENNRNTLKHRRYGIIYNANKTFEIGDESNQRSFVPILGFASTSRILRTWMERCFPGVGSNIEEAIWWLLSTTNVATLDIEKLDLRWMFVHTVMFKAALETKCDLQRVKLLICLSNDNRGPMDQFLKSIDDILMAHPERKLNAQLLVRSQTFDDLFRSRSIVGKLMTFGKAYNDVVFCSNCRWIYAAFYRVIVQWLNGTDRNGFNFRWRFSFPREKHCTISKSYVKKYQNLRVSLSELTHEEYHAQLKKFERLPHHVDFTRRTDPKTLRFQITKEDEFAFVSMTVLSTQSTTV